MANHGDRSPVSTFLVFGIPVALMMRRQPEDHALLELRRCQEVSAITTITCDEIAIVCSPDDPLFESDCVNCSNALAVGLCRIANLQLINLKNTIRQRSQCRVADAPYVSRMAIFRTTVANRSHRFHSACASNRKRGFDLSVVRHRRLLRNHSIT